MTSPACLGHEFPGHEPPDPAKTIEHHILGFDFLGMLGVLQFFYNKSLDIEMVVVVRMVLVGQFSNVELRWGQIDVVDGPQNFHRIKNGDGFLDKFSRIFVQVDDVTDILIDDLVSEQDDLNGFVIPEVADDLDELCGRFSSICLKGKLFFVRLDVAHGIGCGSIVEKFWAKINISNVFVKHNGYKKSVFLKTLLSVFSALFTEVSCVPFLHLH